MEIANAKRKTALDIAVLVKQGEESSRYIELHEGKEHLAQTR